MTTNRSQLINENLWFAMHQELLCNVATTPYGRALLNIPDFIPEPIIQISKSHVRVWVEGNQCRSYFWSRAPIGDAVRRNWSEFARYAQQFYTYGDVTRILLPNNQFAFAAATTTFNPDASPETTSVDGVVHYSVSAGGEATWDTMHDSSAGHLVHDSNDGVSIALRSGPSTNRWRQLNRCFFLFDTSSLTDTDFVTSTNLSLSGDPATITTSWFNQSLVVCASTPASNTILIAGDYDQLGTTDFSNRIATDEFTKGAAYEVISLNADGLTALDLTGVSKYGLRFSGDIDDVEPTWLADKTESLIIRFVETTSGYPPVLTVTHFVVASAIGAPPNFIKLLAGPNYLKPINDSHNFVKIP